MDFNFNFNAHYDFDFHYFHCAIPEDTVDMEMTIQWSMVSTSTGGTRWPRWMCTAHGGDR